MGRTRCLLHICGNTKEEDEREGKTVATQGILVLRLH